MTYDAELLNIFERGKQIVQSIMASEKEAVNGNSTIIAGNRTIADTIQNSSKLVFEGLSNIADELERKRKSEEYYSLLDRIDCLEDKILQVGGNLQQVYSSLNLEYKEPLTTTSFQMRFLINCFNTEERFNWLKEAVAIYQKHPIVILGCLLADSHIKVDEYKETLWAEQGFSEPKSTLFIASDCEDIIYTKEYVDGEGWCIFFGDTKKRFDLRTHFVDYCNAEEKADLVRVLKEVLQDEHSLATHDMIKIRELNSLIAGINWQIVLGNLRGLHGALLGAYKDLKFERN